MEIGGQGSLLVARTRTRGREKEEEEEGLDGGVHSLCAKDADPGCRAVVWDIMKVV